MAKGFKTGGRRAGTPNKLSSTVKDNVLAVFEELGGKEHMKLWASENPTQFYNILAKLMPTEITAEVDHGGYIGIGELDVTELSEEQLRAIASIKVNPS